MRPEITTIVLSVRAIALAIIAYVTDPGLPCIGARNGLSMLWFGWRFLAFPVTAGWLVKTYHQE